MTILMLRITPEILRKTSGEWYLKFHSIKNVEQLARCNLDYRTYVLYNVTIAILERVNGVCELWKKRIQLITGKRY